MACRGVHFALKKGQEEKLLSLETDAEVMEYVQEELEEAWDEPWVLETDKAWDAIHRCLTDGSLQSKGNDIREKCILGGRSLYEGDDYIISYITADDVRAVSEVIEDIDEQTFRGKFFGLKKKFLWFDRTDYQGPLDEDDFEYSRANFEELRVFFKKAADAGYAMIFTVDQ